MPDYFDLAYAAGLIDGEGTIVIERSCDRKSKGHIRHRLHVSVTNTNRDLLEWLLLKFGGKIYNQGQATEKHKAAFAWRVSSQEACDFLQAIKPFLKGKRLQADNAIEFQANVDPRRRLPLTEEELAVREAQRTVMAGLNHKGPI